jgi:hypothetical protein
MIASRSLSSLVLSLAALGFALSAGCGGDAASNGTGATGGTGTGTGGTLGTSGAGGQGGAESGGSGGQNTTTGSGGSGIGGSGNGSGGSGSGSGGSGNGGSDAGGSGSGGGGNAGSGGSVKDGGGLDAQLDGPSDARSDASQRSLDDCFAGLPRLGGTQNVDEKLSADGKVRMRVAIETDPNSVGTSGTLPWVLMRFGLQKGGATVCVTDRSQLKYMGSHHNCTDKATATDGNVRYDIVAPDRPGTTVSAAIGATVQWGPIMLNPVTCTTTAASKQCSSGGPC